MLSCRIGVLDNKLNNVKWIPCRWNGNIEHTGVVLNMVYNTDTKVKQLLNLGTLNILGFQLPDTDLDYTDMSNGIMTLMSIDARLYATVPIKIKENYHISKLQDIVGLDKYTYIWVSDKKKWFVYTEKGVIDLDKFLKDEEYYWVWQEHLGLKPEWNLLKRVIKNHEMELTNKVSIISNVNAKLSKYAEALGNNAVKYIELGKAEYKGERIYVVYKKLEGNEKRRKVLSRNKHIMKALVEGIIEMNKEYRK